MGIFHAAESQKSVKTPAKLGSETIQNPSAGRVKNPKNVSKTAQNVLKTLQTAFKTSISCDPSPLKGRMDLQGQEPVPVFAAHLRTNLDAY